MYQGKAAKPVSAEEAAGLVRSGMWLDYGTSFNQPDAFDAALAARKAGLHDVKIRSCLTMRPRAVLEQDPEGAHFHYFSWHFALYDRRKHQIGRCNYLPLNLGEVPDYYRRFLQPLDIVVLQTGPMDAAGYFSFGPNGMWNRAMVETARTVIVEICDHMPFAHGDEARVHRSEVDFVIQGNNLALPQLPNPAPSEIDRKVAQRIIEEIDDGSCLQIGIGGMPNAVCILLKESGIRDLGVHTEMLTDGIAELYRAGLISGHHKQRDPGKVTYTFALGSQSLYDTVDNNDDFLNYPVDYTNLPQNIMANDNVVSINNTTQIDLQGQCASESDGHRHISGTGGQLQFVRGAYASKGGKSFICLSSTYDKKGEPQSRIVFDLTRGNIVTTPRSDVMYVVTEYGMVNLKGKSVPERASALIGLAHPDFREDLERQAFAQGLLPRVFAR